MKFRTKGVITLVFFVLLFSSFVLVTSLTAAPSSTSTTSAPVKAVQNLVDLIKNGATPVFVALLGDSSSTTAPEFALQVLALILVTLVVYGIMDSVDVFGGKPWINFLIGLVIAVIGVRFMPPGFLESAAMPSSAFVLFIVIIIPFFAAFFFIEKIPAEKSGIRRVLWVLFAVLVFILWIYNYTNNAQALGMGLMIYPAAILGCLLAFSFDGTLQRYMIHAAGQRYVTGSANEELLEIRGKIQNLTDALKGVTGGSKAASDERIRITRAITALQENERALESISSGTTGGRKWWVYALIWSLIALCIGYIFWDALSGMIGLS